MPRENNVQIGFFEAEQFQGVLKTVLLKHLADEIQPVARFATRLDVCDYHCGVVVSALTRKSFTWSAGAWSYCADQIVKDIRTWAQANT